MIVYYIIIPDRLVAGRKILALLTVVRIHLRENIKPETFGFGLYVAMQIDTNHTDQQVSLGLNELRAEAGAVFGLC